MLSRVDLPHPLGPITATISCRAISKLIARTASTAVPRLWKLFETFSIRIMALSDHSRASGNPGAARGDPGSPLSRGRAGGGMVDQIMIRRSNAGDRHRH